MVWIEHVLLICPFVHIAYPVYIKERKINDREERWDDNKKAHETFDTT